MYAITTINRLNAEATRRAARQTTKLAPVFAEDNGKLPRPIPFIGDYRPRDLELVDTLFVDTSGWGGPGEPALTQTEFLEKVRAGYAYALIECGQFQGYVGVFKRKPLDIKSEGKV